MTQHIAIVPEDSRLVRLMDHFSTFELCTTTSAVPGDMHSYLNDNRSPQLCAYVPSHQNQDIASINDISRSGHCLSISDGSINHVVGVDLRNDNPEYALRLLDRRPFDDITQALGAHRDFRHNARTTYLQSPPDTHLGPIQEFYAQIGQRHPYGVGCADHEMVWSGVELKATPKGADESMAYLIEPMPLLEGDQR